jgi:hypothetical protein
MLATYENLLVSSTILYLNNRLLTQGQAFYTTTGQFYPIQQTFNGFKTYSSSFKPLCSDISVPNCTVMTGVYIGNSFVANGQSGVSIDYYNGNVYIPDSIQINSPISGIYSFNEVPAIVASFSDMTILFETKMSLRPKLPQIPTGVLNNQFAYPVIFVKNELGNNEPWALGGLKKTNSEINCYVFAESQFQLDAICSNFKDAMNEYIPLLNSNEFPFNNLGGFKNNIPYNYTGIVGNRVAQGLGALIESVEISDFGKRAMAADIQKMTNESFFSFITLKIARVRNTS